MTPSEISEAIKAIATAMQANAATGEYGGNFPVAQNSQTTVEALNEKILELIKKY